MSQERSNQGNTFININGDFYEQSGNFGSGHSEIKGEAELGGVINEGAQNSKNIPSWIFQEQKQEKIESQFGKLKSEDQKYNGSLVRIDLNFFNCFQSKQQKKQLIGLLLNISFGELEENYNAQF